VLFSEAGEDSSGAVIGGPAISAQRSSRRFIRSANRAGLLEANSCIPTAQRHPPIVPLAEGICPMTAIQIGGRGS